jgi:asparagine synthase (glutamine-hydrolysing)
MCGICGKYDLSGREVSLDLLKKMCDSFAYRGPDDEGYFCSGPLGLGHRRLSIIDLSPAGRQPMSNEDDTIRLVFNGEIYDFEELRQHLQSRGHKLKSRTDSETIIHLYENEGVACLKHLNGMFAFALWDDRRKRLWLARDRLGIKPLVYSWDGRRLIFASEIKAILCDPDVSKDIDPEALDLYLTLNYIPAPWTIFRSIRKLPPGHFLLLEKDTVSTEEYWDIRSQVSREKPPTDDINENKTRLRTLLETSVKRRLVADVPLGAFLSGGVDSSIIVALMSRNVSRPVKTFSIGYRDLPSFDETAYAQEAATFNQTEHYEFKLGHRDILDVFPQVLESLDEPFADSSAVPTYIVSRETRHHVTVALSGDGGDELFAGYRMYLGEYWSRYYAAIPHFVRQHVISPVVQALPEARDKPYLEKVRRAKKFLRGMNVSFPARFCGWREIFPFALRRELLRDPLPGNFYLGLVRDWVIRRQHAFSGDPINLMLYLDVKGLLPGDMLTKVDRMSMVNSLEVRVPFLDHALVEFVFTLSGNSKLKATGRKRMLVEAFEDLLPPMIRKRPKWGFEMPIGSWLRKELHFLIDEYLDQARVEKQGLFSHEVIKRLIADHMKERQDTSWHLWNLIVFQHWYERYMG